MPGRRSRRSFDTGAVWRENRAVARSGASRRQIAQTLTIAYGEGLLSEDTFLHRLDQALARVRSTREGSSMT